MVPWAALSAPTSARTTAPKRAGSAGYTAARPSGAMGGAKGPCLAIPVLSDSHFFQGSPDTRNPTKLSLGHAAPLVVAEVAAELALAAHTIR